MVAKKEQCDAVDFEFVAGTLLVAYCNNIYHEQTCAWPGIVVTLQFMAHVRAIREFHNTILPKTHKGPPDKAAAAIVDYSPTLSRF